MLTKKRIKIGIIAAVALVLLTATGILLYMSFASYGYAREVSAAEKETRDAYVAQALGWCGVTEQSDEHLEILSIYNSHTPLARGYAVQPEDNWCATFVSTVAIQCGYTGFIPTECGCQRQIELFEELGCWVEDDGYIPLPGDIIYYSSHDTVGNNTGWSDHVGIVVGTNRHFIKVVEGNMGDRVGTRVIPINHGSIRGFAVPDFE